MNNFWTTFTHTAGRRLKSKTFIITTSIMALFIISLINLNTILETFSGDGAEDMPAVAVVDQTSEEGQFAEMLESLAAEGSFEYIYYRGDVEEALSDAEENEFTYVLELTGTLDALQAEFYGEGTDFRTGQEVQQDVQRTKETLATSALDLNEQELALIFNPVSFNEKPLSGTGEVRTAETHMQTYWMVYGLVFVIYLIVVTLGTMIATEVATEKSSRVMELIVSSVNPVTQMLGKIMGIGLAGLVNLSVLVLAAFAGSYLSGEDFIRNIFTEVIDYSLIIYALLFIILGYFVYGGVAAMLGALVSRAEEVNQAIQPLIFLAMIAFFVSLYGLNAPDAIFIRVLSYVPFFTPQLLFLRIGMGTVPVWEIAVISALLIISAVLINVIAARIYKGGVLMYGKFSFKKGIKQALKLSKKES
ncbi:ABC transporter permease [Salipaludibacillus aurantiacus]|uniref:ABC-2 type transport system permease protein n=1 Tax=Salipaludibacillus aurantiacus TaxID=1601833 RepID=A0A1H9NVP5_9BACI|nr:ABC transporter permease [Salipaludibacillus aurantiacus]SER40056.1 ABC-2 type transport system permease protein [Salipaludibacillus aurantiacus]